MNNCHKNLCSKYDITEESLKQGIDVISRSLGKIADPLVMIAITELLLEGDIKEES